jgi:putative SOS response-associated peptidase YedK
MCGRFTLAVDISELLEAFPQFRPPGMHVPRYNIAPTQPVAAVPNDGSDAITFFRWGLIPSWAKDLSVGSRMINARAETLAEKPSFRAAYRRRRCLIFADGFYEWKKEPGGKAKTPVYVHMASGEPFAFAGLWEIWHSPEGDELRSCTIITTTPNDLIAPIHNRMPAILARDACDDWLDPAERAPETLQGLLKPYPAAEMAAHAVSALVNNPANDSPECVVPV